MGNVFKKTVTRPLPPGAEIITRQGVRLARWRDGKGKTRTSPVTTGQNGADRIRDESGTTSLATVMATGTSSKSRPSAGTRPRLKACSPTWSVEPKGAIEDSDRRRRSDRRPCRDQIGVHVTASRLISKRSALRQSTIMKPAAD